MIEPHNFQELALNLLIFDHMCETAPSGQPISKTNKESIFRTTIDRSYYASFLSIRIWLKNIGIVIPNGGAHTKILEEIRDCNRLGKDRHTIAGKLEYLRDFRNDASYEVDMDFNKDDAVNAIDEAEEMLKLIP
jgi:uncharacterized protein (UPF0332 family)